MTVKISNRHIQDIRSLGWPCRPQSLYASGSHMRPHERLPASAPVLDDRSTDIWKRPATPLQQLACSLNKEVIMVMKWSKNGHVAASRRLGETSAVGVLGHTVPRVLLKTRRTGPV